MDDNEIYRIRHRPDKAARSVKNPMLPYELRTHQQVADILGLSRQRVVQIEQEALAKLRRGLRKLYEEQTTDNGPCV